MQYSIVLATLTSPVRPLTDGVPTAWHVPNEVAWADAFLHEYAAVGTDFDCMMIIRLRLQRLPSLAVTVVVEVTAHSPIDSLLVG